MMPLRIAAATRILARYQAQLAQVISADDASLAR
jgi:hypothetical protein